MIYTNEQLPMNAMIIREVPSMDSNQIIVKTWNAQKINSEVHINKIYSFFKANREVGYIFHGESHDFWECMYIENGCDNCMITVAGNRIYNMGKGKMVFLSLMSFINSRCCQIVQSLSLPLICLGEI